MKHLKNFDRKIIYIFITTLKIRIFYAIFQIAAHGITWEYLMLFNILRCCEKALQRFIERWEDVAGCKYKT